MIELPPAPAYKQPYLSHDCYYYFPLLFTIFCDFPRTAPFSTSILTKPEPIGVKLVIFLYWMHTFLVLSLPV